MWCYPHLKRKLMVAGGRKKKKKEYHIEEVGLGWIFRKFFRSASLKPC